MLAPRDLTVACRLLVLRTARQCLREATRGEISWRRA
jgi:hypothetical protein